MSKIELLNNKGFKWYYNETTFVKGYFFDTKNNYYEKEMLYDFFSGIDSDIDFINRIKEINGVYSVVIKHSDKIFIASDTSLMFPLFYSETNNGLLLSDNIENIKEALNITEFDNKSENELITSAHILGDKTLLKNVYRLQSNEYIVFKNNKINKRGFFFSYSTNNINQASYQEIKTQAIQVFENAFERFIISLNNRPVVLPLSGGFDSRLIAVMLKKYNYEDVICFTFGKKNNCELENSRKTAEKLNYKWIFIEYSNELIGNYLETSTFKSYVHFAGKYSSMPFLQEYFAVKHLKDNKLVSPNSVFIPGHSGDFLGGSQLVKVIPENLSAPQIPTLILKKKFFYNKISTKEKKDIESRILETVNSFDNTYSKKFPYSVFEDFDIKEKLAKFIFNSSCVFNFFGFEHRLPFWDKELLMFFKNVPFKYKKMKLLYDDILKNHYFEPYRVNFEKEIQPTVFDIYLQKIINRHKPFLPGFIKKKQLIKNDWKNYSFMTNQMVESIKKNKLKYNTDVNSFNEFIIQWYLFFLKGLIK